MDSLTIGCGLALVAGAVVIIGLYGGPSRPKLVLAPPERVALAPHTPDEAPENDYTGSLASVVYAGHRKAAQAVSGALKAVRRYWGRHRVIERHRVARWSVWANRRGAWWPRDQKTLACLGHEPRHAWSAA